MSNAESRDLRRFLDRLSSRSDLLLEERQAILDLPFQSIVFPANTELVQVGERVEHCSLVADGLAARTDHNADGERQITALHIPGDAVDLRSFVQPIATSAIQTLTPTTVFKLPHKAIRIAIARYPSLGEALWRDCAADAAILSQWIVNIGRRDARTRIAHLLCEIAVRTGAASGENQFAFPFAVSQNNLADASGLTAVHVNRVLRTLRELGIAEMRRTEVAVLHWNALVSIGEFDASYLKSNMRPE